MKGFNPLQQLKTFQKRLAQVQEELAQRTVEASAGGGMVTATANGRQEILKITIDRQVVDPDDVEMLEDLVTAAVNEALKRSQQMMAEEIGKLAGGVNLPPGLNIPGLF